VFSPIILPSEKKLYLKLCTKISIHSIYKQNKFLKNK
jgi:hypothetical protein